MVAHEHESRTSEHNGQPDMVAAVAIVVLMVLAFFFLFNWNGGTVAVDVPTGAMDAANR
ncbi:hypothetical protein [Devosia sp.]|uniref:hypothetical protein n=1 Tax=Devosia sp. TaxID=1871048 RepID=UPI002EDE6EC1